MDVKWKNPDYLVRYLARGYFTILFFMFVIAYVNMVSAEIPMLYDINGKATWYCGFFTVIGSVMLAPLFFTMPYGNVSYKDISIFIKSSLRLMSYVALYIFSTLLSTADMSWYFDEHVLYYSFVETIYLHYINFGQYLMWLFIIITFAIPSLAFILKPFNKRGESYGK